MDSQIKLRGLRHASRIKGRPIQKNGFFWLVLKVFQVHWRNYTLPIRTSLQPSHIFNNPRALRPSSIFHGGPRKSSSKISKRNSHLWGSWHTGPHPLAYKLAIQAREPTAPFIKRSQYTTDRHYALKHADIRFTFQFEVCTGSILLLWGMERNPKNFNLRYATT